MKKILFMALAFAATTAWADVNVETEEAVENEQVSSESEFLSEEKIETGIVNEMIEKALAPDGKEELEYGAKVTKYASVPKFGGYFIGKYAWNSDDAQDAKAGFSQRLIRVYVDGTILNDFTYRMQYQINNASSHMKDFFVEWGKYKEVKLKIGQFKRAFSFENPMNPWDVGTGDYSLLAREIAGIGTSVDGIASDGGRDQMFQVQGDLLPMKDGHRLIHYQVQVANGQGINSADKNQRKDLIGTIQFQPIKNLFIGAFGWKGNVVKTTDVMQLQSDGVTVKTTTKSTTLNRNRYALGEKYTVNDWVFRSEYAHSNGCGYNSDAFYATVGIPVQNWWNVYLKYDQSRKFANEASRHTMYSVASNFRLHKNLMFQLQYNYNDNRLTDNKYSELWLETYVRF